MSSLLQSIKYTRGKEFQVLDQLRVPQEPTYRDIKGVDDGVDSIKTMQVRGAPLIAMVGCLSIAVEIENKEFENGDELLRAIEKYVQACIDARPTAVNMKREENRLVNFVKEQIAKSGDIPGIKNNILNWIEELFKIDYETNKAIGDNGAEDILKRAKNTSDGKVNVLTHCNTGSLATSNYGTALGVVRSLFRMDSLNHAFFTETRPYNQGSRLTAFELLHDKIPSTLLALVAKEHGANFYVAAPFSTIDGNTASGDMIVIEERSPTEVTHIGGKAVSPEGVHVWNPAFDVTPAKLITGIITEKGVFAPSELSAKTK